MTGEGRLAEAKALLERLVAFESVSDVSNLPVIDFVEGYLGGHGLELRRAPNGAGDKAAILSTIGPRVDGGIVLWVIPTSCRLKRSNGRARRSHCVRPRAASMAVAPAT